MQPWRAYKKKGSYKNGSKEVTVNDLTPPQVIDITAHTDPLVFYSRRQCGRFVNVPLRLAAQPPANFQDDARCMPTVSKRNVADRDGGGNEGRHSTGTLVSSRERTGEKAAPWLLH
jgi:hypothetical protein